VCEKLTAQYVVKKMAKIHCAKGPKNCKKCREYAKEKRYALLDTNPQENEMAARPLIELEVEGGEKVWVTFDVIAYFESMDEVKEYTTKKDIEVEQIIEE